MIDDELKILNKIIHEAGLLSDAEFFKNHRNRRRLHATNNKGFLKVNRKGVPVFPVVNQYGGMSISVLKRSMAAAKRLHKKTGDTEYVDIMDQLKVYLKSVENKTYHLPINYKINGQLKHILKKTRDLGSLSNLGGIKEE